MNKVILMGRLAHEPELAQTVNGTEYVRFSIAVNRRFTDSNGERKADFISCTAWRKTAEFICRYFNKGSMIAVVGSIQTDSYEKDGAKVYTTNVSVDEVYFAGEKKTDNAESGQPMLPPSEDEFEYMPIDEDLPFLID